MKKALLINLIIVVAFILFCILLDFCSRWADTYNLGAEMILGIVTPWIYVFFAFVFFCSTVYLVIIYIKGVKNFLKKVIFRGKQVDR